MNFKSITAFILAATVFFVGVFTSTENTEAFLDFHAALIVFGGTFAVAAIAFQFDRLFLMVKVFFLRVIRGDKENYKVLIEKLLIISESYAKNDPNLKSLIDNSGDEFLKEAMGILMDDFLDHDEMVHILNIRVNTVYWRYQEDAKKFKALGKFPPAMGLMELFLV